MIIHKCVKRDKMSDHNFVYNNANDMKPHEQNGYSLNSKYCDLINGVLYDYICIAFLPCFSTC